MLLDNVSNASVFRFLCETSANHTNYLLQGHGKLAIVITIHTNVLPTDALNFPQDYKPLRTSAGSFPPFFDL